jgi:hypothetical protein
MAQLEMEEDEQLKDEECVADEYLVTSIAHIYLGKIAIQRKWSFERISISG